MSKARRAILGFRFKYGGFCRRLLTFYKLATLVVIGVLIFVITIGEYDDKNELVTSKLDQFQSVDIFKHTSTPTANPRGETKYQAVTENLTFVSKNKVTFMNTVLKTKDMLEDVNVVPPLEPPIQLPVIKLQYRARYPRLKFDSKAVKLITPKKLTNRDVLNGLAHPKPFPVIEDPVLEKTTDQHVSIGLNDWIRANNPHDHNQFIVYSAYWDDRFENNNVRIMAIMVTKNPPPIFCRLHMPDGKTIDARAVRKVMNEHWRLRYASCFISCEVGKNVSPPLKVAVSLNRNFTYSAMLPVQQNKENTVSPRGDLAVCVKPLHYFYDRATWLLEFIELHRSLGVEHFFFYNHTVGPNVEVLLRHYMSQNLVTVLPWSLPIISQKEIRTEGIFSSLNDCVFRTMYIFHYAILLDFDEYIIPREHDDYLDMLHQLEEDSKHIRGRPGSFVFKNTFFYLYWENDTNIYGVEPEKPPQWVPYLITQYKTRRLATAMKIGSRSKYILVPERVLEVGNHVVWRHTSGSRAINVPDSVGLLHHYRICEFGGFSCLKKESVVDRSANRFGNDLLKRVMRQCRLVYPELDGKCPLSPPLGTPW